MCGIFGAVSLSGERDLDQERFSVALSTMHHRGPDAGAVEQFGGHALLGHRRLSIIDLGAESNQPMQILGRYWCVYNGEIFNYIELRRELEAAGARFRTTGDTEVLLHAYAHWGEGCVEHFNGMWAFAIYDTVDRQLFCSRDRFGEKPFSYAIELDRFIFASEIKALLAYRPHLAVPDYESIANFCRTSVGAQHTRTWFKDVQRLAPGHSLTLRNGQISIRRYWHYPSDQQPKKSLEDARREYAALFQDAVRLRMRSDVPLGLTLSAGVDSSSIAYAMHKVDSAPQHCFTARFAPEDDLKTDPTIYVCQTPIDESLAASQVAAELDLHSHVVETRFGDLVGSVGQVLLYLESGNSSPAVLPLMQLLQVARNHVTVLLEGQGADELLGGYVGNVLWPTVADLITAGRVGEAVDSYREFARTYSPFYSVKLAIRDISNSFDWISKAYQRLSGLDIIYGPLLRDFTRRKDYPDLPNEGGTSRLARSLLHQHSGGLVNLLHYGDAISMANSLESRLPFLDHRLVELVWRLPSEFKVKLGIGKHIHRAAMRGLVPDRILDQKVKFGFNTPISRQFRTERPGAESPIEVLLSQRCAERGIFDRQALSKLIEVHKSGHQDHGPLLYRLLSTELWFRQFIDARIATAST
jgi:asparagine synthase (glutamine-hydrolysing)